MAQQEDYFPATRHPWPCFLFLLPLLVLYEAGVLLLGGMHPETLRNGADNWLRWGLGSMGVGAAFAESAAARSYMIGGVAALCSLTAVT